MRRWGLVAAALAILGAVGPADGYRLRARSTWTPTSAEALHWQETDFPLRFRMLENDNLPPDVELTQAGWTDIVERSLVHWTGIPTAQIEIVLEEEGVPIPQADQDDGINTIGFSSAEDFVDSWFTAYAAWRLDGDQLVGCDIEVNPDFVKNWAPQDPYRLLEVLAVHEMGHCLGLGHTEPHPMPLWTDLPVHADPSFLPDPVMSYSNSYGLELTEDDTVPVSLLYPAPGFFESRGSVTGRLASSDSEPVSFAYVRRCDPANLGRQPGPAREPSLIMEGSTTSKGLHRVPGCCGFTQFS